MKTPIALSSNDWHIQQSNIEEIKDLVSQKIKIALEHHLPNIFVLGDIFQSRQSQSLSVLKCFEDILNMCEDNKLRLVVIPGNHDKTDYYSNDSFLDSFNWHPALFLVKMQGRIPFKTKNNSGAIRLIPYFKADKFVQILNESIEHLPIQDNEILLSHQAVNGSVNNDGSKVESPILPALLKDFKTVLLGHYHNYQRIGKTNIYHLPSIKQNNFGEDDNKGFTLIYDDGSFEIINSSFKKYKTIEVNVDNISKKELNNILSKENTKNENVRVKIIGKSESVKSIKTDELRNLGFSVKVEQEDINVSIEEAKEGSKIEFNDSSILEEFKLFCEKESIEDSSKGFDYLKTILGNEH